MFSPIRFATSAVILGLAGLGAFLLTRMKPEPAKKPITKLDYLVTAETISRYTGTIDLELTGVVVPYREINISAQASGRVISKAEEFEAGKFVKEGTELLRIDPTDYELDIVRLEAELAAADSSISELEVELKGAQELLKIAESDSKVQLADFQRKREAGGFSKSEIDQVRRSVLAAQTTLTNQENRVALLEKSRDRLESTKKLRQAQLEQAQIQKSRCLVTAPADGVIVQENVELGNYVTLGASLLTFEDTSKAEISCNLRPDQLDWLWNHTVDVSRQSQANSPYQIPQVPVLVMHESGQDQIQWQGKLDRYDGIGVDERTKTIPCLIVVDNPIAPSPTGSRALVRGMFVKLRIELPTEPLQQKNQFYAKIPSKGLLAGNSVWMVRNDKLVRQEVTVVDRIDAEENRSIIIELAGEGIQDTDKVVISPVGTVAPDAKIQVLAPGQQVDVNGKVTLTSKTEDDQPEQSDSNEPNSSSDDSNSPDSKTNKDAQPPKVEQARNQSAPRSSSSGS